ncbi:kynureninase [Salinisphaera hydrothermalis]|uniref:kynureninase n=1 Tax=Salinisphaera hydrothermalis TaxID=563188 RepID=UPI00334276D8
MTSRKHAERLDAADPLAHKRNAFDLPKGVIYLDGNSLGPLTHAARAALAQTIDVEWAQGLIGSWNTAGWVDLPRRVGARIAPLIGAGPDDVICTDGTSLNLFKVLSMALDLRPQRMRVISERHNFPTDLYVAEQAVQRAGHGQSLTRIDSPDEIDGLMDEHLAVLMLTHVDYRTGAMHDLAAITERARAAGAIVVWDLAHSAGAVPLDLRTSGADFAVGCGYKYLNGGPGAPAFIYAHPRHHRAPQQPLAGWFGHEDPFAFDPDFAPAADMRAFLAGTPGVLGMRALEAALDVWTDVDMGEVRAKSVALCELFIETVAQRGAGLDLTLASPREAAARGSQVSFRHPEAYAVMRALIDHGVVGDMRAPDILRFGLTPL